MNKELNELMNERGISDEDKPKMEVLLDELSKSIDKTIVDFLCNSFSIVKKDNS